MSDDLLSLLTRFHREVVMPDVREALRETESRVMNEMLTHFDEVYRRLDRLESEYHALSAAVTRIEKKLEVIEADRIAIREELRQLKSQVADLQRRIEDLESST